MLRRWRLTTAASWSRTDAGKIEGKNAEGTDQFLGVPYAAPPVGPLRWAAPLPVTPWPGIRSATSHGNRCPQLPSGNGPRSDTEDCLYLNVFTPPGQHQRMPGGAARHPEEPGGRVSRPDGDAAQGSRRDHGAQRKEIFSKPAALGLADGIASRAGLVVAALAD